MILLYLKVGESLKLEAQHMPFAVFIALKIIGMVVNYQYIARQEVLKIMLD